MTKAVVYTIDVEAGNSVVVVSRSHESMLVDVGLAYVCDSRSSTDVIVDSCDSSDTAALKRVSHRTDWPSEMTLSRPIRTILEQQLRRKLHLPRNRKARGCEPSEVRASERIDGVLETRRVRDVVYLITQLQR